MLEKTQMIVGNATRYIAGRNAVQTTYWRKSRDVQGKGFLKYNKTCNFGKQDETPQTNEVEATLKKRYS